MMKQSLKKTSGMLAIICGIWILSACVNVQVTEQYDGDRPSARPGAGTAASSGSGGARPSWTQRPYSKYDQKTDIAAVGTGSSAAMADKDAFAKLIAQFGQSIKVDEKVAESYSEAVSKGITTSSFNTSVDNTIVSSASMDSLVGADIGDRWDDAKGTYYAVAVMNKANAAKIYREKITTNQELIEKVVDVPAAQKNTLEGFSRYQFAATLADINISYGNLLQVIGAPMPGLKKGDDYRLLANDLAKSIPIGVIVTGDSEKRIETTFRDVVSSQGFQSGGANARYVLNVTVKAVDVPFPGNANKFCNLVVTANLVDNTTKNVLIPYNFEGREGHANYENAVRFAYTRGADKIKVEFKDALSAYLSQLLPTK